MEEPGIEYQIKSRDESKKGVDSALGNLNRAEAGAVSFQKRLAQIFTVGAIVGVAREIGQFTGKLINLASAAEETQSKFNVVFRGIGEDAEDWVKQITKDLGRSEKQFKGYAAAFQDTFVPLGFARDEAFAFSKTLVALGADLASFNDEAESDTMNRLKSGMTGNVEVFKQYGVVINAARINQELFTMGIKKGTKAATEAQKAQAILTLLLEGTKDAQGDAARTAGSFANQMRRFQSTTEQMGTDLGTAILPLASLGLQAVYEKLLKPISEWIAENQNQILSFFVRFPEIVSLAFTTAKENMKEAFTLESIRERFQQVGTWAQTTFKNAFEIIGGLIDAVGTTIWKPLEYGFIIAMQAIRNLFVTMINFFIEKINFITGLSGFGMLVKIVNEASLIAGKLTMTKAQEAKVESMFPTMQNIERIQGKYRTDEEIKNDIIREVLGIMEYKEWAIPTITAKPLDVPEWQSVVDDIRNAWKTLGTVTLEAFKDQAGAAGTLNAGTAEAYQAFIDSIGVILNKPYPDWIKPTTLDTGGTTQTAAAAVAAAEAGPRMQFTREITSFLKSLSRFTEKVNLVTIVQDIKKGLENLRDRMVSFVEKMRDLPTKALSYIDSALEKGMTEYARKLGKKLEELTPEETKQARRSAIGQGALGIAGNVVSFFTDIINSTQAYQEAITSLKDRLTAMAEGPVQGLIASLGTLREVTNRVIEGMGGMLQTVLSTIGSFVENNKKFFESIGLILNRVFELISQIVTAIAPLVELVMTILRPLIVFVALVITTIGSLVEWLGVKIVALGESIANIFRRRAERVEVDWGSNFREIMQENFEGFFGDTTQATPGIETPLPGEETVIAGGVTVTRPPDQTFNFYINGTPVAGTDGLLVNLNTLVELVTNAASYEQGLTVYAEA